jgi:hypothetical protein
VQAAQSPLSFMIDWLEKHLTPCFLKSHFGFDCPGCGMQRAFIALLKGDLATSLSYHPALIPFILTFAVLIVNLKLKHPKGGFVVMWLFIITTAITLINYAVKQYAFLQSHS